MGVIGECDDRHTNSNVCFRLYGMGVCGRPQWGHSILFTIVRHRDGISVSNHPCLGRGCNGLHFYGVCCFDSVCYDGAQSAVGGVMTIVEYTDEHGTLQCVEFADAEAAYDFADTVLDAMVTEETMWDRANRMAREARLGT